MGVKYRFGQMEKLFEPTPKNPLLDLAILLERNSPPIATRMIRRQIFIVEVRRSMSLEDRITMKRSDLTLLKNSDLVGFETFLDSHSVKLPRLRDAR